MLYGFCALLIVGIGLLWLVWWGGKEYGDRIGYTRGFDHGAKKWHDGFNAGYDRGYAEASPVHGAGGRFVKKETPR